jgi:hypothetical protein
MTIWKLSITQIPSALAQWKFTEIPSRTNLLASNCSLIAPSARSWTSKQLASWITGINNWLSRFFLQVTIGSIVNDFKISSLSWSGTVDGGATFESLRASSIREIAVATRFAARSSLITKRCKIIDVICWDVWAGSLRVN